MLQRIMHRLPAVSLAGLFVTMLVAGCSSPQFSRIDQNREIYESWPVEIRQLVLDGKVEPGMTPEMVRVSWGEPTKIATPNTGEEIWIYETGGSDGTMMNQGGMMPTGNTIGIGVSPGQRPVIGGSSSMGIGTGMGGVGGGSPVYIPPTPPDVREVVFRNGVVHRADKPLS